MWKMALTSVALLFLSCVTIVFSYSSGPPTSRCSNLLPGHPTSTGGSNPGGFYIYSDLIDCNGAYNASQAYTIRLQGSQNFKGFIIQARESGTSNLIGTFSNLPSGTQLMGCGGSATVSHNNGNAKSSVTVTWTSPASTGTLDIRYTVVVSRTPQSVFYANMAAASFRPSGSSCTLNSPVTSSSVASSSVTSSSVASSSIAPTSTPAPSSSTQGMPSSSSTPPTSSSISPTSSSALPSSSTSSVQPTNLPPACPSTDKTPSSDFPIVFKSPTNCDRASCTFYWAMGPNSVNSQYLDIYMEGTVDGWMAVGFSLDQSMGMDDVLGCKIENNAVTVLDTWNPNGYTPNVADSNSSAGICTHSTSYTNGRMSCLFSRSAGITNQGQDYNLDSSYYILRAYRTNSQPVVSFLYKHSSTPTPSSVQYNPMRDSNTSPSCPSAPTDTSAFPIVFKSPTDCDRASCTFYWAMGPKSGSSQYLDVYMEGTVDGWMAVGFSLDQSMGMDDVLGCKIENNAVTVLDTWNPNGYTPNVADSNSSAGICTHSTSYTNGRMSCLFSRTVSITNQGQDYNLDSSYYILRAYRTNSQPVVSFLYKHSSTPTPSSVQYNPMRDSTTPAPPTEDCPQAPSSDTTYPFRVGSPGDDYYFAANFNSDNSSFIDMRLEGKADGYIAVGFTATRDMYNADVVGCKRNPADGSVSVIDTWNPSTRSNLLDASQSGICRHTAGYSNGRISCTFSKYVGIIDSGQDLDLNATLYRIYNAYSSTGGLASEGLSRHTITPSFSSAQTNLLTDIREGRTETVDTWPKQQLLKTHGTFMTIAWLVLAMSGAFLAAWMKPVLPNGEWFIAHRILMAGSLIVGVLGFILPFIAHARSPTPGLISFSSDGKNTAHFVIGIIIMCLHIANPIIAVFRCNPKGEKRWIFNLSHAHIIGYALLVLSFINIALGAHLLDRGSFEVAGFYIVFIILLTLFQVFLFIIHAYNAHNAPEKDRPALVHSLLKYKYLFATSTSGEYELKDKNKKEEEEKKDTVKPEKKKPIPSALIRTSWIAVIGHLIAVAIAVEIMIILIAFA
ncbi:PREDICTED: flocculation protein FLO11-like isoform X2 [Amphimedon queenslandica]|uniref:Ferric-chelate reductase 1 n=1 Tax=Amphimedon queenslandica TaxID=400682 RepID=A0AAN0J4K3_AMPQE|nr:PREDICTED: flocculation protein FLO11-like isoform X2 [Amphimedon queenslandica]|eukprot:XP_019851676.1 PREDICTED: flocculation protein FLO11-like isoform X2 [Amphimedon queenslandica]